MGERLREMAREIEACEGRKVELIKRKILAPEDGPRKHVGMGTCSGTFAHRLTNAIASNSGLPHPDFILQPGRKIGCEIKSGRGRPRFEATLMLASCKDNFECAKMICFW